MNIQEKRLKLEQTLAIFPLIWIILGAAIVKFIDAFGLWGILSMIPFFFMYKSYMDYLHEYGK